MEIPLKPEKGIWATARQDLNQQQFSLKSEGLEIASLRSQ